MTGALNECVGREWQAQQHGANSRPNPCDQADRQNRRKEQHEWSARARQREKPYPESDRHRGGGRPPTPATPPCVRVRTRRFETFGLTLLEQRRKTAIAKVGIRERNMQRFRMGQMTRAMGRTGSISGQLCPYT